MPRRYSILVSSSEFGLETAGWSCYELYRTNALCAKCTSGSQLGYRAIHHPRRLLDKGAQGTHGYGHLRYLISRPDLTQVRIILFQAHSRRGPTEHVMNRRFRGFFCPRTSPRLPSCSVVCPYLVDAVYKSPSVGTNSVSRCGSRK